MKENQTVDTDQLIKCSMNDVSDVDDDLIVRSQVLKYYHTILCEVKQDIPSSYVTLCLSLSLHPVFQTTSLRYLLRDGDERMHHLI